MRLACAVFSLVAMGLTTACLADDRSISADASGGSSSSVVVQHGQIVGTIRGTTGIVNVQGDKVELSQGTVSVNGRSYGTAPSPCEIKYVISHTGRTLYVDQHPRGPAAGK
jgi:hypothetical protein